MRLTNYAGEENIKQKKKSQIKYKIKNCYQQDEV